MINVYIGKYRAQEQIEPKSAEASALFALNEKKLLVCALVNFRIGNSPLIFSIEFSRL